MRHPVVEFATRRGIAILVAVAVWAHIGGVARLRAQGESGSGSPAPTVEHAPPVAVPESAKPGKKSRKGSDAGDAPAAAARSKKLKEFAFPLSPHDSANKLRIPESNQLGVTISRLMADRATRIDNEHVQMSEMNIDLYHPDGKEDFHITMPSSVFNLKTRIITSEDPVVVRTQDFELTGEKMEFNTLDRTGKLLGKVRMLIHNLKQVTGQIPPSPKPE